MKKVILLTIAMTLAGCQGGGGDSAAAPTNTPNNNAQAVVWDKAAWGEATWK